MSNTAHSTHKRTVSSALETALETIRCTIPKMGTDRPHVGRADLSYSRCGNADWVDGFWSGQLWLAYAYTEDDFFFKAAREQLPYFSERLKRTQTLNHDLGFLYSLSAVADYKLTGDADAKRLGLAAAEVLAARFVPAGGFIQAWNEPRSRMIIDTLENLSLLFWAAGATNDPAAAEHYRHVACTHALSSVRYLLRSDGSSYHAFDFDLETGEPKVGSTHQGYASESCWSRGQAWAVHGFAHIYQYTKDVIFLETSRRAADYAIANLPDNLVPFWDYRLPEGELPYRDTSAGAITAAGLFLLADGLETTEHEASHHYREVAYAMLNGLSEHYSTSDVPHAEGLLKEGAYHVKGRYPDNMVPFGDYFYLEALLRAEGFKSFFW